MGAYNEYPLIDGYENKENKTIDIPFSKDELLNILSWFRIAKDYGQMVYGSESLATYNKIKEYISKFKE